MSSRPMGEMLLESLVAIIAESSARVLEVNPEIAKLIADDAATRFSDQFGGASYYVPKGRVFRTSALYREAYERFTGDNVRELAREYGWSVQHMYRVLTMERERDRQERQAQLPGLESQQ